MPMENSKQIEMDHLSGTLDAMAAYIAEKFGLSLLDAAKVSTLLWLEQECEFSDPAQNSELNVELKSLTDFGDESTKARGMVADSRVFINVNQIISKGLASIPAEIVEDMLLQEEIDKITVKLLLRIARSFEENITVIPEGLACVCMRAWRYVKKQKHIPFQARDVMPGRENPQDENSRPVCELTQDDGRQGLGTAKWQCPHHKDGNYCLLTPERVEQMLDVLEQKGVLVTQSPSESPDGKRYLFL